MIFSNCTVCIVYGSDSEEQKRIRVKCSGDRIILYLIRENELPDSERVRIDFFDEQIGCIKTYCNLMVRRNYDSSVIESWMAECEVAEVIEIAQGRRNFRTKEEKEIKITSFNLGEFYGDVQNISVDGIYFVTRTRLRGDDTIEFKYTFIEKEYQLKATLIREEDFRDGRYGYGCQFAELPKGAGRDIRQYVFKMQNGSIW